VIPYKDLAPKRRFPYITILMIAINVGVFAYMLFLPEAEYTKFIYRYSVIPLEFKLGKNIAVSPGFPPIFSIITAMFLHGGWLHIIGNMLYLWIFGDNVEDRMGAVRFFLFYFLCGIVATLAQIYGSFGSEIPALGASGAISGVLAAYLRLYPKAKVAVLIPIFFFLRSVLLPAWLVLGFWFVAQILETQLSPVKDAGGVAYYAHIGGFVAGFLLLPLFTKKAKAKGRRSRQS